jgi:hypothetical protein
MQTTADKIRQMVSVARPRLSNISPDLASARESPDAWSKKEILGHLIDSAANNHQRFVRGALGVAVDFPAYDPPRWVEVQCYQQMDWAELVELFAQYNFHLCRVLDTLPQDVLCNSCNIGKEAPVTLEFVITDYLRHLGLHLNDLLETKVSTGTSNNS